MDYIIEEKVFTDLSLAVEIAKKVDQFGGHSYFVGGYVRDEILGIKNEDIDVEIHGISRKQLCDILSEFGEINDVGAGFGVYGVEGYHLDVALPRREKVSGKGHKDFEVTVDPFLGTEQAAIRRDFTINALMKDVMTGEIIDHFSGRRDLKERRIRHVNAESFVEDPLRLFRGAQFAARFACEMDEETIALCQTMDVRTLPKERVLNEMKKAMLQSEKPSVFFEELRKMRQLTYWFPEVEALIAVPQSSKYHKEGDVWIHTMMVLDRAAGRRDSAHDPFGFMIAALAHDFGKAIATDYFKGDYHAYGHEQKGLPLVKAFLDRLSGEKQLTEYVLNMVALHMRPLVLAASESTVKKTNKLFDDSVEAYDLIQLAECDASSSIGENPFRSEEEFLMERLHIYEEMMERPYVTGKDLIEAGLKPDKNFKEILEYAHKLRLAGVSKENALIQTLSYARKKSRD